MSNLSQEALAGFKASFAGNLILPADGQYQEARKIWNAMIDKKPAVIAQVATAADVPVAIAFARNNGLELSIRGAGHNIAGNSLTDGGLVIDFAQMKAVTVDAAKRRVTVQPGATLADLDAATQAHGLVVPVGINSTTGIAGLTLGGGFGWLTRKFGMTIDNLLSVNLVTVDGQQLTASAEQNPELFWAVRGGGGNFGVITQFEFAASQMGPEVLAGLIVFPLKQAKHLLTTYREYTAKAPEELTVWCVMRKAPPLPFLPETVHGTEVLVVAFMYSGKAADGEKYVEQLKAFGDPHGAHAGVMPFAGWQQGFDPLLTPGARNYWKSHNFTALSDDALDMLIEYAWSLPSNQCEIFIAHIAGAANRVAADAMAYSARDAKYVLNVHSRWDTAGEDELCIGWARKFFKATKPFASGGAYVNFMTAEEGERVESAYGANYQRLLKAKQKYDPDNILHMNQNIKP